VLVIACAADCKKGFFDDLQRRASEQAMFLFKHLDPFSWSAMIDWELSVARRFPSDIICFVDAWDFIMQGTAQDVIAALGNSALLYHSEAACWPEPHKADAYPSAPTRNRFVNGTGPCGFGYEIERAISYGIREWPIRGVQSSIFADNDQRFWTDCFLAGFGAIDYHSKLSVSLNAVERSEFAILEHRLVLNSGITPAFVHANGASRRHYAAELERLR